MSTSTRSAKPVIVVTGASKGIGLAVTKLLLEKFESAVLAISRTDSVDLRELATAHGDALLHAQCDVTDSTGFANTVALAMNAFGRIDGLILNAGTLDPVGPITGPTSTLDAWRTCFEVNFFSLISALQVTIPLIKANGGDISGRVVFVSSGASTGNTYGWAPYNSSKAAVNSLCRTLAQEEPTLVCVAVRPGKVDTAVRVMQAQLRQLAGTGQMRPEDVAVYVREHEAGKLLDPSETGHVLAAMVLKASKELTGKYVSWDSEDCSEFWDSE